MLSVKRFTNIYLEFTNDNKLKNLPGSFCIFRARKNEEVKFITYLLLLQTDNCNKKLHIFYFKACIITSSKNCLKLLALCPVTVSISSFTKFPQLSAYAIEYCFISRAVKSSAPIPFNAS